MPKFFPNPNRETFPMPVTIRSAAPDDVTAILAIETESATAAHWSRNQYEPCFAHRSILVAEENGNISGFLCARLVANEWEVENIVVAEAARRRGIAHDLLEELMRRANSQEATAIWLEVRESNHPARQLYEKYGFRETGKRRAYYRNPEEDAVLYGLHLLPK
jgi:ribosomal-protein-alanine N-acetyltransferase